MKIFIASVLIALSTNSGVLLGQAYKKPVKKDPFVADSIKTARGVVIGKSITFSDSIKAQSDPVVMWLRNATTNASSAQVILSEDAGAGSMIEYDGAANEFRIRTGTGGPTGFAERLMIHRDLDAVVVGRGGFSTTSGVVQISMGGGSAEPASAVSNTAVLYAVDVLGVIELKVMDSAGNKTLLSPHDPVTNEWIFYSVNTRTGKAIRVDMEKFFRWVDETFGTDFFHESYEAVLPVRMIDEMKPRMPDNLYD